MAWQVQQVWQVQQACGRAVPCRTCACRAQSAQSVPAVPMTEPIAREERLRMRQSGRKTKMERSTIMKLLLASSAGPPTSFPMEAKLSPTMIE